jgi:hypothetical protein
MAVKTEDQMIEDRIASEGYEPQILVNNEVVTVEAPRPRAAAVRGAIPGG